MSDSNNNSRLETFCDSVFAIALTLLIIDIKIPSSEKISNTNEFWLAIQHIAPSILAFVLSFGIILISWVNHHNNLKLVRGSSPSFIYANGLLLLTIVFLPFPTSLVGEYILTDQAAPAVIIYNSSIALQSIGWGLISSTALNNNLGKNERSIIEIRKNRNYGYYSFILYTLLSILALWFPIPVFVITVFLWIFWLIYGIRIKNE